MKVKVISISFLLFIICASVADAQNDNHVDNFTNWEKITDSRIKNGNPNSVYYRILNCTTILNKRYGNVAHPLGKIEIKASDDLSNYDKQLTGFINIVGKKNVYGGEIEVITETIQQFFLVSPQENVFAVEMISLPYFKIDNIYLTIFDNDISEVYSAKDDEVNKEVDKTSKEQKNTKKESKDDMTENQVRTIFDLIFGMGSSKDLTINDGDKKEARLLLTELIKGSCKMAVVEGLQSLDASIRALAESIYTMTSNCYDVKKKGRYYETVRKTMAYNFSSAFQIRKATGEW